MVFPLGPAVNAALVVAGSLLGLSIGARLPERVRTIVFQGLGLCTMVIGMQMALTTKQPLILIFSILLGAICGELLNLEDAFLSLGDKLKKRIHSKNPQFTQGIVNASVLFCIGAMAILGSFDEGLRGDRTIVYSKSIMDCFAAMALSTAYGIGVAFSAVTVFLYQGAMVVLAGVLQPWLTENIMRELTAVGGVMIIGISLNLLKVVELRLSNFIPALVFVVILTAVFL